MFISLYIESQEGLENAKIISELDGVDNIYYGTYDIVPSMKLKDQNGEEMQSIIEKSIDNLDNGVSFGQVCISNKQFKTLDQRINMVVNGVDCGIILNGAKYAFSNFS